MTLSVGTIARIVHQRLRMRSRDAWTRQRLLEHQTALFATLRRHAYAHSAFYRRFHDGLHDRPLADLPVLSKSVAMENFDALATDPAVRLRDVEAHLARGASAGRYLGRYTVSATSGSTGQRGFFLHDPSEWAVLLASYARPAWWAGFSVNLTRPTRIARIGSPVAWHQTVQVGASTASKLAPALELDATRPVDEAVAPLNAWQPDFLTTYASVARALAVEQLAGRLRIAPRMIGVGAEVLSAEARSLIEAAWGKVVYDHYGASEFGILAADCACHEGLHLFEDLAIVEVVDAAGRLAAAGSFGERVLVTSLVRRAQPLIRYEISDRVRLAERVCGCGRPYRMIEAIQGRAEETLYFPDAAGARVAIDPLVFDAVLDTVPARQWQVVQESASVDILLVGLAADFPEDRITAPLQREFAARGAVVPEIRVVHTAAIPRGATGKAALVRSNVGQRLNGVRATR